MFITNFSKKYLYNFFHLLTKRKKSTSQFTTAKNYTYINFLGHLLERRFRVRNRTNLAGTLDEWVSSIYVFSSTLTSIYSFPSLQGWQLCLIRWNHILRSWITGLLCRKKPLKKKQTDFPTFSDFVYFDPNFHHDIFFIFSISGCFNTQGIRGKFHEVMTD